MKVTQKAPHKRVRGCVLCKHANHMTMTTINVNIKLRDLCETDCLHFAQYISISPHAIDCKET